MFFRGGSDLVDEGRVAVAGDEAGPDPLDLVRAGLAAGENRRLDGLHRAKLETRESKAGASPTTGDETMRGDRGKSETDSETGRWAKSRQANG